MKKILASFQSYNVPVFAKVGSNNPINLIDEKIVPFKITLDPLSKLKTSSDNVVISTTITTERIAKF